ncbi:MAG: DUF885 family protein [Candidatus Aminicenantes bacterium]|nr:MAG: DUF885 family protein [Candidatus Aminicenantes bacterium]
MKSLFFRKRISFRIIFWAAMIMAGMMIPATAQDTKPVSIFETPKSGDIVPVESELKAVIERYSIDELSLSRHYTFPFSPARRSRFTAFYREWLDILAKVDFGFLSQDAKIDYILFKNHLLRASDQLEKEASAIKGIAPFLPFAKTIIGLNEDLKKMRWVDGPKAAEALADIKSNIDKAGKFLATQGGDINKTAVRRALAMMAMLQDGLKEWFDFYNGYNPLFTWWVADSYKDTTHSLQSYEGILRKKLGGEAYVIMDPVGREVLMKELAFEMIPYTPEEILALGWQELAWCEKERLAATLELGYGENWKKAIEHVKNRCVEPGEQPELIRFMAFEAIDFLEKNDSLTIPPMVKDLIRMRMMSIERQQTTPFFTGGEVISVAYPTNTVPYDKKISTMRGNNPHFSRAVVHHELVPGHNLQGFMSARHKSYRRPFSTSFFGEGWPLYWEMRLWDMGFQRSPEDRIGMLFWRMHRCARIIFSLSFHLGHMTADEAVDFLVDRIGHERDNATVEAKAHLSGRAYGGRPLAQISYLFGGLQIRALSRELVDSGMMTARDFHDAALREGSIPVELLRAKMIDQELIPDFTAQWKFYTFSKSSHNPYYESESWQK